MSESLRQKTIETRRRHIIDAAIRVFAARGFHRATIRDVAREAGVADGTIYNVFENKTALLFGIIETHLGSPPAHARIPASANPQDVVRGLIADRWSAYGPETLAAMRVVLSEVLVNEELRRLYFDRVIKAALSSPDGPLSQLVTTGALVSADVPMTSRIVIATFMGLIMLRLLGDETLEDNAARVPELLSALLLNGLRPRTEDHP